MVNSSILIADAKIVFILQVYPRKVLKITNRMTKNYPTVCSGAGRKLVCWASLSGYPYPGAVFYNRSFSVFIQFLLTLQHFEQIINKEVTYITCLTAILI